MAPRKVDPNNSPDFGPPVTDNTSDFGPPVSQFTASPPLAPPTSVAPSAPPPTLFSRFGQAVGIPTSMDGAKQMEENSQFIKSPNHPVLARIGNALLGPAGNAASIVKSYGQNLYNKAVAPMTPAEAADAKIHPLGQAINQGVKYGMEGPLGPFGGQAVSNFAEDVGNRKFGPAAGDVLGTVFNFLTAEKGMGPSEDTRLNSLTHATGNKGALQYEKTLDSLRDTQAQMGKPVQTVGDLKAVVNKFKDNVNSEYGNAIGPYANQPMMPTTVSERIRSLITPDMQFTAEGKAEAQAIKNAALEYEKPWTLGALDSKRSRLAADLASHNAKESVARYTAERGSVNLSIDNAILDSLRDTVYPQADALAGKPTGYFENLKSQQSNAIRLEQLLNKNIDSLRDASRGEKGTPALARTHGGAVLSSTGAAPHGYVAGLQNLIHTRDILRESNEAAAKGMSTGSPVSQGTIMSLPARYLMLGSQPLQPQK